MLITHTFFNYKYTHTIYIYIHNSPLQMASTPPQSPKNTHSKEPSSEEAERTPLRTSVASSSTPPSPPPQTQPSFGQLAGSTSGASSSDPLTVTKPSQFICPICRRDMCHKKAFNGHLRWHSLEERRNYSQEIKSLLASSNEVQETVQVSENKELLDLNKTPDEYGDV